MKPITTLDYALDLKELHDNNASRMQEIDRVDAQTKKDLVNQEPTWEAEIRSVFTDGHVNSPYLEAVLEAIKFASIA